MISSIKNVIEVQKLEIDGREKKMIKKNANYIRLPFYLINALHFFVY